MQAFKVVEIPLSRIVTAEASIVLVVGVQVSLNCSRTSTFSSPKTHSNPQFRRSLLTLLYPTRVATLSARSIPWTLGHRLRVRGSLQSGPME